MNGELLACWQRAHIQGGGWRVEGGGWRVEGGGWRVGLGGEVVLMGSKVTYKLSHGLRPCGILVYSASWEPVNIQ